MPRPPESSEASGPAHGGKPEPCALDRAIALVRYLREHCPWDREQTAHSLVPHLLEEAHEVAEAVGDRAPDEVLAAELGDLLLNLAFQIVVGEEEGRFDATGVYELLESKMVRRHPDVSWRGFGTGNAVMSPSGTERATGTGEGGGGRGIARPRPDWEALKAKERGKGQGALAGLAKGLDPLTRSYRMQERVAAVGFDWPDHRGALLKLDEEIGELREALVAEEPEAVAAEMGDVLFAAVNLARLAGTHPTTALYEANLRFRERFQRLEEIADERGIRLADAGLDVLDSIWREVKRERGGA